MLTSYPDMDKYYGLISGMAYSIPMSLGGLTLGMLKGGFNRKFLLVSVIMTAGVSQILTGSINSLLVLALMRAVHGFCNSITQPLYFSLICDYFPKDKRSTANSVI